ncbi:MAG: hypothetical protein Q9225_006341 [Loekoesia sp. 1 TL-2023]
MVGNGGMSGGSSEAGASSGQSQGTEYTLQGVMRFLQTEWHRHERDRNAWQIERAEMKSRIGKLEGDGRTSKRLQESLGKHVKILENALKKEREKLKALQSGQAAEEKKEEATNPQEGTKASLKPELLKPRNSFLDTENEGSRAGELRQQDTERDKSRLYLGKCMQEVTFHVVPTAVSQQFAEEQEQILQNHHYTNNQQQQQPQPPSLEEVYVQQRQKQQQSSLGVLGPSPLPNHQPPPVPRTSDLPPISRASQQPEHSSFMSRSLSERQPQHQNPPLTAIDARQSPHAGYGYTSNEDQIEKVSHSYDAYGRPIQPREDEEHQRLSEEPEAADPDGWNFDDPPEPAPPEEPPQPEVAPPQRPDTDVFPSANSMGMKSPTRGGLSSHRRKSSLSRRRQSDGSHELRELSTSQSTGSMKGEIGPFKVRFAFRGHLDVVRSIIFTGGGSPSEPEICTSGDDGVIKRWIIPASYGNYGAQGGGSSNDLDVQSYFTHRGHTGAVMSLAASPASQSISNGGRALGDGWVFSGGEDATVRVWERGRVDPKATLDGHTDAVWTVCVLPGSSASVLGDQCTNHGGPDRVVLASGAADGTILIWAVSTPPQQSSPHTSSRRGPGGSRRANSVSSGSNFPSSPQPSTATTRPFHYSLVHRIERADHPSPTCISPLSASGDTFVVSFADASVLIYGTRTGEEMVGMASLETYDGNPGTGVNAVAATTIGLDGTLSLDSGRGVTEGEAVVHGATGSSSGVEGMILSGHEDRYIRFFDANSGKCDFHMSRALHSGILVKQHADVFFQVNALTICLLTRQLSPL